MAQVATAVSGAEVKRKEAQRSVVENSFCELSDALCFAVEPQWFVVAACSLPLLDRFGGDALTSDIEPCDVVRRVDGEKQRESEQIDANQNQHRIQAAAKNVCAQLLSPADCRQPARRVFALAPFPSPVSGNHGSD